ncbi:MAG: VOC family protein [Bacteroidetes bacterium]|nr:VOC family protein [Bacteroidota bacterium]
MAHLIRWFEIPVVGFDRAKRFYEKLLNIRITEADIGGLLMGFLGDPDDHASRSGAIVQHEWYHPSEDGVLIYFDAGDDVEPLLARAEMAGGSVLVPKRQISEEMGYMAVIRDTEGNRIGLLSKS